MRDLFLHQISKVLRTREWFHRIEASSPYFRFRSGLCVSADAAAVLAARPDLGLRSTFDAAEAARALVTSRFGFRAEDARFTRAI